jgi:hypothetical protein
MGIEALNVPARRAQVEVREQFVQFLPEARHLGPRNVLVAFDPLEPALQLAAGCVSGLHTLLHLLGLLLTLPEKVPRPLHALRRVNLGEIAAFVAHLSGYLQDLRLERAEIRMRSKMFESFPDTVELALQLLADLLRAPPDRPPSHPTC